MAATTRKRTGCWTCRSRKVKCDETRPICHRCHRINATCAYGLRLTWHEESISRGVCHGRSGIQYRNNAPKQRHSQTSRAPVSSNAQAGQLKFQQGFHRMCSSGRMTFLNTTVRDMEVFFEFERSLVDSRDDVRDASPSMSEQSNRKVHSTGNSIDLAHSPKFCSPLVGFKTSVDDGFLLSYYEAIICSSSTLLDNAYYNPYRHIILPMSMFSEGMYHGTMAVSARTLGLSQPRYRVAALEHGQRATRCLIRILQQESHSKGDVDEILGLSLLLCWYEITDGSRPSWLTHLHGIRAISDRYRQASGPDTRTTSLRRFLNRYFAFHLVLARTAFHVDDDLSNNQMVGKSSEMSEDVPTEVCEQAGNGGHNWGERAAMLNIELFSQSSNFLSVHMPLDELHEIDPYMGFSNALLLLINEVAGLAGGSSSNPIDMHIEVFHAKASRLKTSLENLQQLPPSHLEPYLSMVSVQKEVSSVAKECTIIAEVNRLGAILFLHEICSQSSVAQITRPSEDDKNRYVKAILDTIQKNLASMVRTAALPLWPLFLAGCCCDTDDDRITVMHIFQQAEQPRRFGNIQPAREVVEMVWRQQDLSIQDDRKRRRTAATAATFGGNSKKNHRDNARHPPRSSNQCPERFVWEQAMKKLGGWKLSLT